MSSVSNATIPNPFGAFEFEASVRAKKLKNSKGSKQDRIHIMGYNGEKGKDPYAVAAKSMHFSSDAKAKLGWLDRKFYVLHKENDVWYRVNINSFQKRLNPAFTLDVDAKGVCSNLKDVLPSQNTSPVVATQFKELNVMKNRRPNMMEFWKPGEPVSVKSPALGELLDYCESHESDIYANLKSLALPLDLNQCKIKISPSFMNDHKARIDIQVPYSGLIHRPFKSNWLNAEGHYNMTTYQWDQLDYAEFSFVSREMDLNLSSDENFAVLMKDIAKTFRPWYQLAKTIAEYGETTIFNDLILDSDRWQEYQGKDRLKPDFHNSCFSPYVGLDENQDLVFRLSANISFGRNSYCHLPMEEVVSSSVLSFDDIFDLWKKDYLIHLQRFLDQEAYDFRCQQDNARSWFGGSGPSPISPVSVDFKELDELLELNGEVTALENDKKYVEIKDLLKKNFRSASLKWHPDRAAQNGLDPDACSEKMKRLNELYKEANDYLDAII